MKCNPQALSDALAALERQQLRRERATVEAFTAPDRATEVIVAGRRLINFCSNDYLGLARHPALAAAMSAAAQRHGAGSGASHLVTGHGSEHAQLERELAQFTHRERALLFSTGYMANLAVLTTLASRGDRVLLDRLSHASLIDAARLSGAQLRRYPHADSTAALRMIDPESPQISANTTLIATDGVFSMDGDLAPLPALAAAARAHEAWLIVDDAHGLGVLGPSGGGVLEHFALDEQQVPVLIGTLGKALGSFGAFVAGSAQLIELLIQRARTYIYTTAAPQATAAATRCALALLQRESWRRERVLALTARLRAAALQLGIPLAESTTPIQPVVLGSAAATVQASRRLLEAGFWVSAIRPPTVPQGSARLRISLSAAHTEAQVDALAEALAPICRRAEEEEPHAPAAP